jgi:SAM-dependent methyltransferase
MTSPEKLNGDNQGLKNIEKISYMVHHILIYFKSFLLLRKYKATHKIVVSRDCITTFNSPSRDYIDSFFDNFLNQIENKSISVLDIGCGNGYLFEKLVQHKINGHYLGIDLKQADKFNDLQSDSITKKFMQGSAEEVKLDKKFDLIVSVTSLEHIENDKKVLENSSEMLKEGGCEIHVVPAGSSIFLYLLHGWRQYNIGMLNKLFFKKKDLEIHQAGGPVSFIFHFFFITIFRILNIDYKNIIKFFGPVKSFSIRADNFLNFFPSIFIVKVQKGKN